MTLQALREALMEILEVLKTHKAHFYEGTWTERERKELMEAMHKGNAALAKEALALTVPGETEIEEILEGLRKLEIYVWGSGYSDVVKVARQAADTISRLRSRVEWQPIETAPKDETRIDLWLISNKRLEGFRVTDCRRSYEGGNWPDVWIARDSCYVNFSRYYDEHDDYEECLIPGNIAHPKAFSWTKATHWMLPPAGPKT